MQEVDNVDRNDFPNGLEHHPFMYAVKDDNGVSALVVLSAHGDLAYYKYAGGDLGREPATVVYAKVKAAYDKGIMVQSFREIDHVPAVFKATVTNGGQTSDHEVKTVHADDKSFPPMFPVFQVPTPICHIEMSAGGIILHCMAYMEDTGRKVDVNAIPGTFSRNVDGHGNLIDWRLEVPLTATANAPVFQYFSVEVVGAGAINSGEVVRLKMATIPAAGGTGRSFAFVWP